VSRSSPTFRAGSASSVDSLNGISVPFSSLEIPRSNSGITTAPFELASAVPAIVLTTVMVLGS
jgi:hypothetical protein